MEHNPTAKYGLQAAGILIVSFTAVLLLVGSNCYGAMHVPIEHALTEATQMTFRSATARVGPGTCRDCTTS